jgi:hypothetical protein
MSAAIDLTRLNRLLDDPRTTLDVQRYFDDSPTRGKPYTGRRFEALAGGGDRPETANRLTGDDLVAITTLSVRVPAETAVDLLDGPTGDKLAACLADIPVSVALADDSAAALIVKGSSAFQAWDLLMACEGVNWVTASKILARKRPHLLPVYDNVVRCALNRQKGFWSALHAALRADDRGLDERLGRLRVEAGLDARVSSIRVLDVVLWMRHHDAHSRQGCAGIA